MWLEIDITVSQNCICHAITNKARRAPYTYQMHLHAHRQYLITL